MRIALYHNLPPGGALRMLAEMTRRSAACHEYELFSLDLGNDDRYAHHEYATSRHLVDSVARSTSVAISGQTTRSTSSRDRKAVLAPLAVLGRVERAQQSIAGLMDGGDFDVALVHPCQFEQAPSLLRHLHLPSLYFLQEPHRRSTERGYQPTSGTSPSLPHRLGAAAYHRYVGWRDRAAAQSATMIACNSVHSLGRIRAVYDRDAELCLPGVDTDHFRLSTVVSRRTRPSVLSVGALDPTKGHAFVIDAVACLPAELRPDVVLVGEREADGYVDDLATRAEGVGVDLTVHRRVTDDGLVALYQAASVTMAAALNEPFGLTVFESMACGTPVVAVAEGGYLETVTHGVNGFLVDRAPGAAAAALGDVLAGVLGGPEAVRSTVVAGHSWDATVERLHDCLDRLTGSVVVRQ
jgi:glycosyltransferase involved in cell wall biosynthesis